MSTPTDTTVLRRLLVLLAGLQVVHLLDSLRTDPDATVVSELFTPQAIAGVGGALVAVVLLGRGHRWGRALALLTGSLVALGFVLVHGVPTASARTEPYWGDGSADVWQWLGVAAILVVCAAIVMRTWRAWRPGALDGPSLAAR